MGAPLMIGWTFLLIWGDRKPIERKEVIFITLFTVITGLISANITLFILEITSWIDFISSFVVQSVVIVIFSIAYGVTWKMKIDKKMMK